VAIALRGNLQDFGIADVFQLIGQQRKTGLLNVSNNSRAVCLAFDSGSVVWATPAAKHEHEALAQRLIRCGYVTAQALKQLHSEARSSGRSLRALLVSEGVVSDQDLDDVDTLLNNDTIFDVLGWTDGSFDFLSQMVEHERAPEKLLGAEQILMNGLRMVDEWQTFRDSVPPMDAVLEHSGNIDDFRQRRGRDKEQHTQPFEKVYQLIDGRLSLQRVIDLSRLGMFDASRVVAELVDAGLAVAIEPELASVALREQNGRPSAAQRLSGALLACVPLLLLGCMAFVISQRAAAQRERIDAFPVMRGVYEQAHTLFEKRRIRHALEAHRYLTGDWPEVLAGLDESGLLQESTMAPESLAAYYYARSENGIVLLAPKR